MLEVKLNQQEQAIIDGLPESMRAEVTRVTLENKRKNMASVIANREEFSVVINDVGNLVIRGLGNRYPLGLRIDSAELLLSQVESVRTAIGQAREYIANNTVKVAEAKAKRAAEKKAALALKKANEAKLKALTA